MSPDFLHRLWKSRLIPRTGKAITPSVILSPSSFVKAVEVLYRLEVSCVICREENVLIIV